MRPFHSVRYRRFAARLRAARREAGLTQVEAAKLMGKTQIYISRCEKCSRRVDAVEAAEFAAAYGQPLNYFLAEAVADAAVKYGRRRRR